MEYKSISGFNKKLFNIKVSTRVFFYFCFRLLKRKINMKQFISALKRMSYFLKKIQDNKFIKYGKSYKLDLYVPSFPSKAFFSACNKFTVLKEKLPCTTVLISITSSCPFSCKHCYQKLDAGKDVDINVLVKTAKKLENIGVSFFNIEGGEPFLKFDRLKSVCENLKKSEIWINSTGYGITKERLDILKKLGVKAIMFSLHSPKKEEFNYFMNNDEAWDILNNAIKLCKKNGMSIAFNSCIQKEALKNGDFEKIMLLVKEFGAFFIQIILPKTAGAWMENTEVLYNKEDLKFLKEKVDLYNLDTKYSLYPSISAQALEEASDRFGCTAGGTDRFYINAKGDLQPCEFLNISFGNILSDNFDKIYEKMRKEFRVPCNKWLCEEYSKDIGKLYLENNLRSLPLDPNLSRELCSKWNRGEKNNFYNKLKKF